MEHTLTPYTDFMNCSVYSLLNEPVPSKTFYIKYLGQYIDAAGYCNRLVCLKIKKINPIAKLLKPGIHMG